MAMTFYSGDRGTGNVVRWMDLARDQWVEVTPESVDEAILTFVCSRAPKQAR
jgi:hypothetical protein